MTGIIVKPEGGHTPSVSNKHEGLYWDTCPNSGCGARDIEPRFRLGDSRDGNLGSPDRVIYSHNPKDYKGGCGQSWSRARAQAIEEDHSRGVQTKWGTASANLGRYVSCPSDSFRDNYAQVFGHD